MPLSLECSCSDAVATCLLTGLTWLVVIDERIAGSPAIGANHALTLFADESDITAPSVVLSNVASGSYTYALTPLSDWAGRWATISVQLATDASTFQVPSPAFSAYDAYLVTYYINQHFECVRSSPAIVTSEWDVKAYTTMPDDPTQCDPPAQSMNEYVAPVMPPTK